MGAGAESHVPGAARGWPKGEGASSQVYQNIPGRGRSAVLDVRVIRIFSVQVFTTQQTNRLLS